jgi:regulatory protein
MTTEPALVITAIERQPKRRRYNVFVNGEFAVALDPEILAGAGLRSQDAITAERLRELALADRRKRTLDAALRLLGTRPRSESELRERLSRRGLPPDVIQPTIERLRELGYVDDAAFARFWVGSRSGGNARGRLMLRRELRVKGVDDETAGEAIDERDERRAARAVAAKKARTLRGLDYPEFRTRLAGYLVRRGFTYDTVRAAVDGEWKRVTGAIPDDAVWDEG